MGGEIYQYAVFCYEYDWRYKSNLSINISGKGLFGWPLISAEEAAAAEQPKIELATEDRTDVELF